MYLRAVLLPFRMKVLTTLPPELQEQVARTLLPGEQPVWVAQPIPTLVNRLTIPAIFFACFGVFFSALVFVVGGVVMLPFLCLLTGVPVATVFLIRRRMRRTVYVLTEQRAFVLRPTWRKGWQSYGWPLVPDMIKERELRPDGSGDIIFGYEKQRSDEHDTTVPMGFFNLPDVRKVEQLVLAVTSAPAVQQD